MPQSHKNAMIKLSQEELDSLRNALPDGSYKLISEKLNRVSSETVRKVLTDPSRYKKEVIDATIELLKEQKEMLELQKKEIVKLSIS